MMKIKKQGVKVLRLGFWVTWRVANVKCKVGTVRCEVAKVTSKVGSVKGEVVTVIWKVASVKPKVANVKYEVAKRFQQSHTQGRLEIYCE